MLAFGCLKISITTSPWRHVSDGLVLLSRADTFSVQNQGDTCVTSWTCSKYAQQTLHLCTSLLAVLRNVLWHHIVRYQTHFLWSTKVYNWSSASELQKCLPISVDETHIKVLMSTDDTKIPQMKQKKQKSKNNIRLVITWYFRLYFCWQVFPSQGSDHKAVKQPKQVYSSFIMPGTQNKECSSGYLSYCNTWSSAWPLLPLWVWGAANRLIVFRNKCNARITLEYLCYPCGFTNTLKCLHAVLFWMKLGVIVDGKQVNHLFSFKIFSSGLWEAKYIHLFSMKQRQERNAVFLF